MSTLFEDNTNKTTMADINNQTPEFMDFIFQGLDHGVNSISEGGGPLVPFLMTKIGNKKELKRFVTEKYEEGIAVAEQAVQDMAPKPDFALIAFDGFITWEEKKYDAIFVKVFDRTQDEGFEFCQRYIPKAKGNGIEPIGNSAFIGKTNNILVSSEHISTDETLAKKKKSWWKF